jgi:spore germination protein GerM
VMAVGQIVYTVTAVEGVSAVELSVEGSVVDVPVDTGQLRSGPVTRSDYAAIAPTPGARSAAAS